MRAAFRTLATLTPLAWGFSLLGRLEMRCFLFSVLSFYSLYSFSADFVWTARFDYYSAVGSNPASACNAVISKYVQANPNNTISLSSVERRTDYEFICMWADKNGYSGPSYGFTALRSGDACPEGKQYNSQTGACDGPSDPCPTTDIRAAVSCSYMPGSGSWACPAQVCFNSCGYTTSPDKGSFCDSAKGACVGRYTGIGSACSVDSTSCADGACVPVPSPNDPAPSPGDPSPSPGDPAQPCTTYEGTTVCISDDNTGCGTVNGVQGCFTPDKNCGSFNGTFTCVDKDKPQGNCGYANGEKVCFDPKDPTKIIPSDSPDHPNNGGNADGKDNNDPLNPSDTSGTSPQGSNEGATNESIDDLGEKLGEKIDRTNRLLDGIDGVLDGIKELLGSEYDSSAEWSDAEAGAAGAVAGDAMGQSVATAVDDAIAERDAQIGEAIDAVPSAVDELFGSSGERIPGLSSLGDFLPEATSCIDYVIPINAMGVSIQVTLPVCFLSRFKTLIEWVLWCLTAIGLWNIFYSGLRLENAKASKGGY